MTSIKPAYAAVAERLIAQLEAGTAPWQKPWKPGEPSVLLPTNPTTGKRYKGINAIQLMSHGKADPRWMTRKQAESVGAQVRSGEQGATIQCWKFSEASGPTKAQGAKPERPLVFLATVFNAEQIDGLPPLQWGPRPDWNAGERAEKILRASGAEIRHGESDRAFYRPETDSIHLPDKTQFATPAGYYAIALHELGHWTGHASRLGRDQSHPYGSTGYAREELRAEIASMILGDELGIGHDPGQHAAYVDSWIRALRDDPLEIFRAAADAEKIQRYVLGLEQEQQQAQAHEQAAEQVRHQMRELLPAVQPTPYMQAKGITPQPGVFTDRAGRETHIPVVDAEGRQWSLQTIAADGRQHFAQGSRKNGCFHAVGGMAALARAPALVVGESYASASSLAQTLGFATVAALDAGNLPAVAQALHARFPDKPVVIAGDDDRHLELTQGINPGKAKAREAAKLTGGTVLLPIFAPGENSYPAGLDAITPQAWRAHQRTGNTLSAQQLAALEKMQAHTDFNDLAQTSQLGQDGLDRQVRCVVSGLLEKRQQQVQQQRAQRPASPAHGVRLGAG